MKSNMNLVVIDYYLKLYICNSNQEQIDGFIQISKNILHQVYAELKTECENVKITQACLSILSNCIYLDINVNIEIIPQILELYKRSSYQSIIDVLLQNLVVDNNYNHHLLQQPEIYTCISIYIHRNLVKLMTCIKSYNTMKMENNIIAILLDFVYIYMLNNEFNDTTKDTFHDSLYVLINCAYCNYIQSKFISIVIQLYKTSYYPKTRYLILNYLYNVYHYIPFNKYLIQNVYTNIVQHFIANNSDEYPQFCQILEQEINFV